MIILYLIIIILVFRRTNAGHCNRAPFGSYYKERKEGKMEGPLKGHSMDWEALPSQGCPQQGWGALTAVRGKTPAGEGCKKCEWA